MPIDGVVMDGEAWCAPGYWISVDGLTVLKETGEGAREKLEVVEQVEVHRGLTPGQTILVGVGALVVGAAGGVVGGVVLGQ